MPEGLETITVEINKPRAKPFFLNTWYKPPDMPIEAFDEYEQCIQKMDSGNKELYASAISNVIGSNLIKSRLEGYHIWLECINLIK